MPRQSSCCAQGYDPDNAYYPHAQLCHKITGERLPTMVSLKAVSLWNDLIQGRTAAARSNCVLKVRLSLPYMSGDAREQFRCGSGGMGALLC